MTASYEQPDVMNKRVRFYDGQFLQDQDFIDEQKYHVDRRQRLTRFLHVSGIVDGLEVRTTTQPFQVRVTAGTAVDRDGRQLVLAAAKTTLDSDGRAFLRDASEPVTLPDDAASGEHWLYLAYYQVPDDLQASGEGVEGETRWHEAPYLFTAATLLGDDDIYEGPTWRHFLTAGPPPPILLARLTLAASGSVTIDNSVRRYSGLRLPGLRGGNQTPMLRAEQDGRVGLWLLRDGDSVEHLSLTEKGYVGIGSSAPNAALEIRTELKATVQNRALVGLRIAPAFNENNLNGVRTYGLLVENGSVGIGTDSPVEKVTVSGGNVQMDGKQKLVFSDEDTSNNLKVQLWAGYGLGINRGALFYAANGKHSWRDSNGANERMALTTGAAGGLTVTGTGYSSFAGRLGLGTTTPAAMLEVVGDGGQSIDLLVNGRLCSNNNDGGLWVASDRFVGGFSTDKIGFWNDGDWRLTVQRDGNVGVGTATARARLEVNGNLLFSGNHNITTRRGILHMGTTDGSQATRNEVIGAIGFWGYGVQHGQLSFRVGHGFEMVDRSVDGPALNYTRDAYNYADLKVRHLHLGNWTLSEEGEHLYIKRGDQIIARFSPSHDRFMVFRNLNGAPPYFFYNSGGHFGTHSG